MSTFVGQNDAPSPRFAVLMVTHNNSHFVGGALRSWLLQHDAIVEVLIIDCGSFDNTQHMVASLADVDDRVRLCCAAENDVVSAYARLLEASTAPYVVLAEPYAEVSANFLHDAGKVLDRRPDVTLITAPNMLGNGHASAPQAPNDASNQDTLLGNLCLDPAQHSAGMMLRRENIQVNALQGLVFAAHVYCMQLQALALGEPALLNNAVSIARYSSKQGLIAPVADAHQRLLTAALPALLPKLSQTPQIFPKLFLRMGEWALMANKPHEALAYLRRGHEGFGADVANLPPLLEALLAAGELDDLRNTLTAHAELLTNLSGKTSERVKKVTDALSRHDVAARHRLVISPRHDESASIR